MRYTGMPNRKPGGSPAMIHRPKGALPAIALLAGIVLAACTAPAPAADLPLEGHAWKLAVLNGKPVALTADQEQPTLAFDPGAGRITGSTGCNSMSGLYRLDGARVTIERVAMTRRACLNGGQTEQPYVAALEQARSWKTADGQLTLSDASGQPILVFRP